MNATLTLSEVVLERDGQIVAAYDVRRDVRGDVVLLDHEARGGGKESGDTPLALVAVLTVANGR